jgi:DNA-binding response OmpR family regulator|tara:strand:- start:96 stop:725 length:630 start_codon:yes stop_codon:yes gene_type:complete
MKPNLLIFGTKSFNNSLDEIKEDLGFLLTHFNAEKFSTNTILPVDVVIVDVQICENNAILSCINKIVGKPILLLDNQKTTLKCKYNHKILLPVYFLEFQNKINNLIISNKFSENSTIKIKEYTLDKNERKLKKGSLHITITEREVQLIELLFNEKKPLSRSIILKRIWKYADDADTHTVETHIYRLRKKISDKFQDINFIMKSVAGYFF